MKSREGVQEVIQEFFDTVDLSDFMKKHRKALCIKEGKYVLESYNDLNKDVSILYDSLVTYSKEFGSSPKLTVLPQEFDNYKSYFDFILSSSYADLFKNNYRKLVLISGKDGLSLAEMKENVVKSIYFEYITREGLSVVECIADDRVFNLRSGDDLRFFRNRKDETYTSSSFIEVLIKEEKRLKEGYVKDGKVIVNGISNIYVNTYVMTDILTTMKALRDYTSCYKLLNTEMITKNGLVNCQKNEFKESKLFSSHTYQLVLGVDCLTSGSSDWNLAALFDEKPWFIRVSDWEDELPQNVYANIGYSVSKDSMVINKVFKLIDNGGDSWCFEGEEGFFKPIYGTPNSLVLFKDSITACEIGVGSRQIEKRAIVRDVLFRWSHGKVNFLDSADLLFDIKDLRDIPKSYFSSERTYDKFFEWCSTNEIPTSCNLNYKSNGTFLLKSSSKDEKFLMLLRIYTKKLKYAHYKIDLVKDFYGASLYYSIFSLEDSITGHSDDRRGSHFGVFLEKKQAEAELNKFCSVLLNSKNIYELEYKHLRELCLKLNEDYILRDVKDEESYVTLFLTAKKSDRWIDYSVDVDKESLMLRRVSDSSDELKVKAIGVKLALRSNIVQTCIFNRKGYRYVVSIWDKDLVKQIDPNNSWEAESLKEARSAFVRMRKEMNKGEVFVIDRISKNTGVINQFFVYNKVGHLLKISTKKKCSS